MNNLKLPSTPSNYTLMPSDVGVTGSFFTIAHSRQCPAAPCEGCRGCGRYVCSVGVQNVEQDVRVGGEEDLNDAEDGGLQFLVVG